MSIVFDPFTGQIIDTGPSSGMAVGGPVAGADPNSVLVVDGSLTLQDITMPIDGQLLIGSAGNLPVAATLTQASASQVVITNGPGSITLGLPQNISSADSPTFANLYLSPNGSLDLNAAGTLNIGQTATTINIGNGVTPGNINLYGNTFYQEVVNLEVTDKNILLNKNGGPTSAGDAGLSIEEGGSVTAYAQISTDRNSWTLKAPNTAGIVTITPGASGFTIDQGSHNPITIATPANGLSVDSNQELSIALVNNLGQNGALSSTKFIEFEQKVDRAGDTMSGNLNMETTGTPGEILTLSSDGLSSNIETQITTEGNLFLTTQNLVGSNTGDITIQSGDAVGSDYAGSIYLNGGSNVDGNPANIQLTAGVSSGTGSNGSIILNAKNIVYLNQNLNGSISAGPDSLNPKRIENVADPQADQDAATKKWTKDLSILNNVLYVSTTGSIFTGNGSLFDPYDSIATALAAASNGDLIALLPGTYNEPTVVIPNTLSDIHFSGMLSGATIVTNGFSYTSLASSVNIQFDQINVGQLTLDATLALNGLIEITRCNFSLNRSDNNGNVLVKSSECTVFGGTVNGTFNATECLFVVSPDVYSGLSIFENCKYVARVEAHGNCIVRMLDCELFGATEFINGTVVGIDTPTWQVDLSTEYLGGFTGSINKVVLANIDAVLPDQTGNTGKFLYTDGTNASWQNVPAGVALATYYDISSVALPLVDPYSPDGITVVTGDKVLFGGFDQQIYTATVSGGAISWVLDASFVPQAGALVSIQAGDVFGLQTGKFDGANFKFNNFVRYFNGSDYWEQSSPATISITNNATTEILRIAFLNSENIVADYSLTRGSRKSTGTFHITTDGIDVVVSDTGVDLNLDLGVSFVGSIDGSDLVIECVADNSDAGTLKLITRRWSDGIGGPAGIPSYTTGNYGFTVKDNEVTPTVLTNINTLKFDSVGSGFIVSADVDPNTALIEFASTFKTWNVASQPSLVASGTDTVEFIAGTNISITTDNTPGSKSLTINSTGGASVQTQTINNNTTAVFATYDPTSILGVKIEFALHRLDASSNTRGETGRILVISDGGSGVNIVTDSINVGGATGITFNASYNGISGLIEISYTSTNFASNGGGTLKYITQNW